MISSERKPLVSIVVINYNYCQFLEASIGSAINQEYENIEIIFVDDGSTDASKDFIVQYLDQLIVIHKENDGQASAMNIGFAASRGKFILFLDSDDFLFPEAVSYFLGNLPSDKCVSKLHAPLIVADPVGNLSMQKVPYQPLSVGDLKRQLLQYGPESYVCPPTSGNLWAREFLTSVFPIPHKPYRTSADAYLFTLSPLFGETIKVDHPVGGYRLHGNNAYWNSVVDVKKLRTETYRHLARINTLRKNASALGLITNVSAWKLDNRYYLAKIVLLAKLQGRTLSYKIFLACLRSSVIAAIALWRRGVWAVWFCLLWLVPRQFVSLMAKPFLKLRTRL